MSGDRRPTAAVVVIGNEILSGKVDEQNAAYLIRRFREVGVRLRRVVIIPDDVEDIGRTVREMSERHDVVCTTGGVGPTHDDITVDSIARAFNVPVERHPSLVSLIQGHFGAATTEAHLRLAAVPAGAEIIGGPAPPWPTVLFRNIYIFPGIPNLMAAKFEAIVDRFVGQEVFVGALEVAGGEAAVCDDLDRIVAAHPRVEIGSYPRHEGGRWLVRLTVEGVDRDEVEQTWRELDACFRDRALSQERPRSVASGR
ncbi:MAG: competence/damage-inducible protein A [Myxococcota bacterium]